MAVIADHVEGGTHEVVEFVHEVVSLDAQVAREEDTIRAAADVVAEKIVHDSVHQMHY